MSDNAPAAVINVQPANYVTKELFDATITPIANDVSEMKGDVKLLLAAHAGSTALQAFKTRSAQAAATVAAGTVGAVLALVFH